MGASSNILRLYHIFSPVMATVLLWTNHLNENSHCVCLQLTSLSAADTEMFRSLRELCKHVYLCVWVCASGYQAVAQESLIARRHSCSKELCRTWYTHLNDGPQSTQVQADSIVLFLRGSTMRQCFRCPTLSYFVSCELCGTAPLREGLFWNILLCDLIKILEKYCKGWCLLKVGRTNSSLKIH